MIHVFEKTATTLEELREIPVEVPANAGAHWQGIQHGELVDTIIDECTMRGWEVKDSQFSLASGGTDLVGALDIGVPGIDIEGVSVGIGFVNNNQRRKSLKLYAGGTVEICRNGLATGSIVVNKKHSKNTILADEIDRGLDKYFEQIDALPTTVARLQETQIEDSTAYDLINKAGKEGLMPKKYLWDVVSEYYYPTHTEHGWNTGWALLNAFTQIVKRNPPHKQMDQIAGFRNLILSV